MDRETAQWPETIDYSLGDYSFLSSIFEPSSQVLVDAAGVSTDMHVLDVAAGDGNTALAAARRGAAVTALDISPAQLERGRKRTEAAGLAVQWVEGDADRLPFADGSFDCALSTFGIDEGNVNRVVAEMLRVVKPGGVIGITDWTREGVVDGLWKLHLSFLSSTDTEQQSTDFLGNEGYVRSQLNPHASHIDMRRRVIQARFESVDRFCGELWRRDPEMRVIDRLFDSGHRKQFLSQLRRLIADWNTATDGSLSLELNYLLTVAQTLGDGPSRVAPLVPPARTEHDGTRTGSNPLGIETCS